MPSASLYRHFKGGAYLLITKATDVHTSKEVVVYMSLLDGVMYTREVNDFFQELDRDKYPEATQKNRFEAIPF